MTCIVGLIHNGDVWMGGDAAGVSEHIITTVRHPKVFHAHDNIIMGWDVSFRMGQLLQYRLKYNPPKPEDDLVEWMVNDFIDAIRKCMADAGYRKDDDNDDCENYVHAIVGLPYNDGVLYEIGSDYGIIENGDGYTAIGCGAEIALGALYATREVIAYPQQRLRYALEAAAYHTNGVRPPFTIISTGDNTQCSAAGDGSND